MAKYRVTLMVEGSRLPAIQKEAEAAFKGEVFSVRKVDPAKSRADRLASIQSDIESAAQDVQELTDEMQEWFDSIPENLQSGEKASEVQEAIDALEELSSNLNDVDFSVSFPSMM